VQVLEVKRCTASSRAGMHGEQAIGGRWEWVHHPGTSQPIGVATAFRNLFEDASNGVADANPTVSREVESRMSHGTSKDVGEHPVELCGAKALRTPRAESASDMLLRIPPER